MGWLGDFFCWTGDPSKSLSVLLTLDCYNVWKESGDVMIAELQKLRHLFCSSLVIFLSDAFILKGWKILSLPEEEEHPDRCSRVKKWMPLESAAVEGATKTCKQQEFIHDYVFYSPPEWVVNPYESSTSSKCESMGPQKNPAFLCDRFPPYFHSFASKGDGKSLQSPWQKKLSLQKLRLLWNQRGVQGSGRCQSCQLGETLWIIV